MQEIARECGITFKKGDILLVRVGVTREWERDMDEEAKRAYARCAEPRHAGVEGSMDVLRWLWDSGFAAVASDAISWEVKALSPSPPFFFLFYLSVATSGRQLFCLG